MIQILTIGQRQIPYQIRESSKAKRKRIEVSPEGVRVIVPQGTPYKGEDSVASYVYSQRKWVFRSLQKVQTEQQRRLQQRYASGARLQFRGRWLGLDVVEGEVKTVQVLCRSRFHVTVPCGLSELQKLQRVRDALHTWLRDKALKDVRRLVKQYSDELEVEASSVSLSDSTRRWGICTTKGTIRIHWQLIQAPRAAFEYVVAHEVAHLKERNHGVAFWNLLATILPDWSRRKALLEQWESEHRAV